MISEAVQAYLAELDTQRRTREGRVADDELGDSWFSAFDASAHVAYEDAPPTRFARLGAWLRSPR